MGEYAKHNGREIKIGTCEQMYYLRADQVHLIDPLDNSVNPKIQSQAESIRFRFPFPQEDGTAPGAFDDYDYGLGIFGIEPPEDEGIEHYSVQFASTSPKGMLVSVPCPRSKAGKASALKVHYNGYSGPVHIHSQRLVDGKLVLILRCGDCGALYRVPTLEECKPVLDVLNNYEPKDAKRQEFYSQVAQRIVDGYTEPNYWTPKQALQAEPKGSPGGLVVSPSQVQRGCMVHL